MNEEVFMCECSPGVASFSSTAAVTEDQQDGQNDQRPAGKHTQHHQQQDVVLLRTRHQRHVLLHAHACQSEISVMLHTSVHFTENFYFSAFCAFPPVYWSRGRRSQKPPRTHKKPCVSMLFLSFITHFSLYL